jgi:stage IV sporulation protein FB
VENIEEEHIHSNQAGILPKPVFVQDKKNWMRKSLISIAIYAFIFMVILKVEPIYGAALLIVLLIHELGHFFAMKAFNYSNPKIFVLPMLGSFDTGQKSVITQRKMSVVILAGPIPGILIGIGLLIGNYYYPNEKVEMLGEIFMGLNFFNLLPFMPLDGGRLLETIFIKQNHSIRVVFTVISILFLLFFTLMFQNPFFLIIPISMVFELISEIKNQKIREYLTQEHINYITEYKNLPDKDYWIIRDCILLSFHRRYAMVQAGVYQYTLIEANIMQHVSSIIKTPVTKDLKMIGKILLLIVFFAFLCVPLMYYVPKAIEAMRSITPLTK